MSLLPMCKCNAMKVFVYIPLFKQEGPTSSNLAAWKNKHQLISWRTAVCFCFALYLSLAHYISQYKQGSALTASKV